MNLLLWIVQSLLALVFIASGLMKLVQTRRKLAPKLAWVEDFSEIQVSGIGLAELLAGIGLVLPPLVHIFPVLSPLAAAGLVLVMLGAVATHLRRSEWKLAPVPLVLGLLAAFIAWARFGPYHF